LFWGRGITWLDLALCGGFYALTMLGITLGFHRLFTHRSFKCIAPIRIALCIAGSMAAQGPVLFWAACHRRHHKCSDHAGDPHSPHNDGEGWLAAWRGLWHSHVGWMFSHESENYVRLAPDMIRDRTLMLMNRLYFVWIALGLLLPGVLALLITQEWHAFWTGILWGGLVRLFLVHHSTWSINSICHLFGASPYETDDQSRNNAVCALLTFGEGWHNNHHAFPTSARHGLKWWQVDFVYYIIRVLSFLRLAWDIRLPTDSQLATRAK